MGEGPLFSKITSTVSDFLTKDVPAGSFLKPFWMISSKWDSGITSRDSDCKK